MTNPTKAFINLDGVTVVVREFKFDRIRQESYWKTLYVKTYKTSAQAVAAANSINNG